MHSIIDKEQGQTKRKRLEACKGRERIAKVQRKSADQIPSCRPSQAILTTPINCWTPQDRVSIVSKPPHALKRIVAVTQFVSFLEFEYIDSGIFMLYVFKTKSFCFICVDTYMFQVDT